MSESAPNRAGRTIAVIIVNYRTADLAIDCVRTLDEERADFPDLRVVLIDGGSADGSAEQLDAAFSDQADWVSLLPLPINGGFAYANNQGLLALAEAEALPRYVLLLNPDARVRRGALAKLVALLDANPRAGAVGARLEHEDGQEQGSAFPFPSISRELSRAARTGFVSRLFRQEQSAFSSDHACRVPWATGAAVALRTEALAEVGLFDDGFFLYFEETELMHRLARAHWEIWHEPAARVVHLAGRATQIRDPATGRLLAKRLPRYWYDSRRRYFVRTAGKAATIAAGLAWLAGRSLWQLRCLVTRRADDDPIRSTRDFLAFSLWPRGEDDRRIPLPRFGAARGGTPVWMQTRK
jgi:GT2 family glycosyltransferase